MLSQRIIDVGAWLTVKWPMTERIADVPIFLTFVLKSCTLT